MEEARNYVYQRLGELLEENSITNYSDFSLGYYNGMAVILDILTNRRNDGLEEPIVYEEL